MRNDMLRASFDFESNAKFLVLSYEEMHKIIILGVFS